MDLSSTIPLLKSQIQSLESEVQFLREELKQKNIFVKSLVTAHVTLSEALVNKNYKEVKSTAESYNKITKKKIFVDDSQNNAIDFEISRKIPMTKSS